MPRAAPAKPTASADGDPRTQSSRHRNSGAPAARWLDDSRPWSGLILLFTCVAFSPLFTSDFTNIDDLQTIADNPRLNPPTLASLLDFWDPRKPQMDLYVPVTYTVWSAVAWIAWVPTPDAAGIHLNSWMFHGANVALHALSALIVFQVLRLLLRSAPIAAAGALLFALHPVQAEPVGWASGTKDVLYGMLSLCAIWAYLRSVLPTDIQASSTPGRSGPVPLNYFPTRPCSPFWYWLATAAFILAMLSKPTAIVTPLIAATLDLLVLRRPFRVVARAIWPWLLLIVPVMFEGRLVQPGLHPGDFVVPPYFRPLIAADALAFYLGKLFWPARLGFIYNRSPQAVIFHGWLWWTWMVPAAAAIAVLAPLANRRLRNKANAARPLAAFAIFVISVLPVLGLVPFDFQQFSTTADHYLYLAMLGPALGAGFVLDRWARYAPVPPQQRGPAGLPPPIHRAAPRRTVLTAIVCATLLAALGLRTYFQARHWHDSISLLEHSIGVNPWSPYLYDNLSKAYADEHLPDEARRWDEESVRRWPSRAASHLNLAGDLAVLNRLDEAEAQYEAVLRLDPSFASARQKLAEIRQQRTQKRMAAPSRPVRQAARTRCRYPAEWTASHASAYPVCRQEHQRPKVESWPTSFLSRRNGRPRTSRTGS